jgi:heme exporter protein D
MPTLIGFIALFLVSVFIRNKIMKKKEQERIIQQRLETLKKVEEIRNKVRKYRINKN